MNRTVILYRASQMPPEELAAAERYFFCTDSRMRIQPGDLVVGRYAMLPFYREQERDINMGGARVVNSLQQHSYVADLQNYVEDLGELTPKTWYRMQDVPKDAGPFVLKGATNSKKHDWYRSMYAQNWDAAVEVQGRLQNDSLIGAQDIYIRKYVPLVNLGRVIGGLPLTVEFRFFVCHGEILCGGFYWDAFHDDVVAQHGEIPSTSIVPSDFLEEAVARVSEHCPFFAMDVGQAQDGRWLVIELNDGQQSGLSANNPDRFYRRLQEVLEAELFEQVRP